MPIGLGTKSAAAIIKREVSNELFGLHTFYFSNFRWSVVGKMEEPRFSMGTVVYDGLIYLVGGCTHSRRHMHELVSFNPVRETLPVYKCSRLLQSKK